MCRSVLVWPHIIGGQKLNRNQISKRECFKQKCSKVVDETNLSDKIHMFTTNESWATYKQSNGLTNHICTQWPIKKITDPQRENGRELRQSWTIMVFWKIYKFLITRSGSKKDSTTKIRHTQIYCVIVSVILRG